MSRPSQRRGRSAERRSGAGGVLAGLLLVAIVLAAYAPATRGGFVWDDDAYVEHNPTLRSWEGLGRIWLELRATPQYYPLVHTSYWLEYRLWGSDPTGYHVVNILLHAAGCVLLWRVLRRLELPGAWAVAAIFAVHPVNVESVAWITERKNVLSGVLYFASALVFLARVAPADGGPRLGRPPVWYALSLVLFAGALLAKTVTGSLPAALLLVLWWKRGRLRRADVLSVAPFFAAAITLGAITVWLEKHHVGASGPLYDLPLVDRVLIAGRGLWFYAGKLVLPLEVVFVYPRWTIDAASWTAWLFPLAAVAVPAVLWLARGRLGRGPLVGVLFFAGTLFPALGFFDIYPMRFSFVADHFQYLAGIGLIAAIVGMATHALSRAGGVPRGAGVGALALVLAVLATGTWRQGAVYGSRETLWRDVVRKNPEAWLGRLGLANELSGRGVLVEAVHHYEAALRLLPEAKWSRRDRSWGHNNLGLTLIRMGQVEDGLDHCREAIRLDAENAMAHFNLAHGLVSEGELEEAIGHYRAGLVIDPTNVRARDLLGVAVAGTGDLDGALRVFEETMRRHPDQPEAARRSAWILATRPEAPRRDPAAAIRLAEHAAALAGDADIAVLDALAAAYAADGRFDDAVASAGRAVDLATEAGADRAAAEIASRLDLYRRGRPYVQPSP